MGTNISISNGFNGSGINNGGLGGGGGSGGIVSMGSKIEIGVDSVKFEKDYIEISCSNVIINIPMKVFVEMVGEAINHLAIPQED